MRGYREVYEALERETGARFGGPGTPEFGLFETACIGQSDHEPAMLIDDVVFTDLTPDSVAHIITELKSGVRPAQIAAAPDSTIHTRGPVFFCGPTDHPAVMQRCRDMAPDECITMLTDSGLRGRGGAGFPTGTKWKSCRAAAGARKYIVCNADEGEPGTFKDRVLLTHSPGQVFTGMAIAAHAVGAGHGIIYLRAEYTYLRDALELELAALRSAGVLGESFAIRIQMGAGAYICGDESALLESCEGKRGTPRLKPPFPVEHGYLGMPTVVNNVETFAAACRIMAEGPQWFCRSRRAGLHRYPVAQCVRRLRGPGYLRGRMGCHAERGARPRRRAGCARRADQRALGRNGVGGRRRRPCAGL
jgi:[NiFe] hydrogenase diaphorase moiety large subunit